MDILRYLLFREAPAEVKQAQKRAYYRQYRRGNEDHRKRDKARKKERYATDPEFRERRKAAAREQWAAMTEEERAAHYQRRKERLATLPAAEYERRRKAAAERCRRWRLKQKEKAK